MSSPAHELLGVHVQVTHGWPTKDWLDSSYLDGDDGAGRAFFYWNKDSRRMLSVTAVHCESALVGLVEVRERNADVEHSGFNPETVYTNLIKTHGFRSKEELRELLDELTREHGPGEEIRKHEEILQRMANA